jgi:hypothetical protein
MSEVEQKVINSVLHEIDALLKQGVLPVHNGHLNHLVEEGNILDLLISMKSQGLISGDLIRVGSARTPHRITNIRLTYVGIKTLRKQLDGQTLSGGKGNG